MGYSCLTAIIENIFKIFHKYDTNHKYTWKYRKCWSRDLEITSMNWHTSNFFRVYLRFFSLVMFIIKKKQYAKYLLRISSYHLNNMRMTNAKRHFYIMIYRCKRNMDVFTSARPEPPEHDRKITTTVFKIRFQRFLILVVHSL